MLSEIKEYQITCDSCFKAVIYKSLNGDFPKGWIIFNDRCFPFKFSCKHLCPDCAIVKDIIE